MSPTNTDNYPEGVPRSSWYFLCACGHPRGVHGSGLYEGSVGMGQVFGGPCHAPVADKGAWDPEPYSTGHACTCQGFFRDQESELAMRVRPEGVDEADENLELIRRLGTMLDEALPGWRHESSLGRWYEVVTRV